ncbi:CBS domain-containing protein [Virgibacillus sp. C22-A2]|uniref:CBS domain-containing protein n=1 Tax=Virgibacillus tibetensis TaxID=3042313 RepID=A0ABU6KBY1_9BACI|nr:CBS domain-containing protein [Virgibacillus sp. C22-A2]
MKIKDFMIKDVISVTKETTIKQLLEILSTNSIGGVPVVDKDNKLIGMISDGDVIRYLQPKSRTVYDMFPLVVVSEKEELTHRLSYSMNNLVGEIMRKKNIHNVQPNDNIDEALSIFSRYRFKKIPVINKDNQVVGVLSRGDLIHYITTKLIKDFRV